MHLFKLGSAVSAFKILFHSDTCIRMKKVLSVIFNPIMAILLNYRTILNLFSYQSIDMFVSVAYLLQSFTGQQSEDFLIKYCKSL